MERKNRILILGIGNTIRGDDGLGVYLVRRLREILPQRFEIKELATAGLDLVEAVSGYDKVILIDAIQNPGGEPGQIYHLSLGDLRYSFNLSSTHTFSITEVLELGRRLTGEKIPQVEILAVEAKSLNEFSQNLSPELKQRFDNIVEKVKTEIVNQN